MINRKRIILASLIVAVLAFAVVVNHHRAGIASVVLTYLADVQIEIEAIDQISIGRRLLIRATGVTTNQSEFDFQAGQIAVGIGLFLGQPYLEDLVVNDARINVHPGPGTDQPRGSLNIAALPRNYAFENVTVHYRDEDQNWLAKINLCSGNRKEKSTLIKLACRGVLNDDNFVVSGDYGMRDDQGSAEPLDLLLRWGQFSLTVSGYLESLLSLDGADLNLVAEAPSNRQVLQLLGIHEVTDTPLSATLNLLDADLHYNVVAQLKMGDLQMAAQGRISNSQGRPQNEPKLDLKFEVAGNSLFELGALFNEFRLQPEPFTSTGDISIDYPGIKISALTLSSGERGLLTGNLNLPYYPSLRDMRATISGAEIRPTLITPLAEFCEPLNRPIDFSASVTKVSADAQQVKADIVSEHLSANFSGTMNPDAGSADLALVLERADIAPLGLCAAIELPALSANGQFNLRIERDVATLSRLSLKSPIGGVTGKAMLNRGVVNSYVVDLQVDVPDTSRFLTTINVSLPDLVPDHFKAKIVGHGNPSRFVVQTLRAQHLTNNVSLSGELAYLADSTDYRFDLVARGNNLREILNDSQATSAHPQPWEMNASIEGNRKKITVHEFELDIVQSHLSLSGEVALSDGFEGSQASLTTRGENLENLLGHWTSRPVPNVPFEATANISLDEEMIRVTNLAAIVGTHSLNANLLVDRPPNLDRTSGDIKLNGPSTHELLNLLAIDLDLLDRPYAASLSLEGTKDSIMVQSISAEVGESDFAGSAKIRFDEIPTIQTQLRSTSFYLPLILPSLATDQSVEIVEPKPNATTRFFSQEPLSLSALNLMNAELNWQLDKVWVSESYHTKMDLDVSLNNGVLATKSFNWQNDFSNGGIELSIDASTENLRVSASSNSARFPILWLLAGEVGEAKNTAFNGQIKTQGKSMAELMANLDGAVLFKDGAGRIQAGKLDGLFGDFLHNISSRLTERKKDSLTNVNCTAGAIRITKGLMSLKPGLVARTDRIDLFASGELNLATEQANISVMTRARTGLGVSPIKLLAPRMKVTGTLAKPVFSIDAASSALSAGAAFFTGGVSVLASAIWDKINVSNEACDLLYDQALKLPDFAGQSVMTVTPQNTGNTNQN